MIRLALALALAASRAFSDSGAPEAPTRHDRIVVTASATEPAVDLRNAETFNRTLFTRDDQLFQQLNAGINAGQHEGGGKSLEIRRFGFNLDHGGVNGGLKVLVDGVQQNQSTQGHGQGYLGALKSLSPELIQEIAITNGPFSAEYGDFSGLGVVHIHQRESLPDQFTIRLQGGNFDSGRGFLAYSPELYKADAYIAYEGSYTNGPFQNPSRYRRDNFNGNYARTLSEGEKLGLRLLFGRNNFFSSGQLPLDLVDSGSLDRFGFLDPTGGGRVKLATASAYYTKPNAAGGVFKMDGFISRSLFDLYSNFTFFRDNPANGDAFAQHDSRLQEGANLQYTRSRQLGWLSLIVTTGANFHSNQINVGLYPREGRTPTGVTTRANARVDNGAGYGQLGLSLFNGRLLIGGGLRFDEFRFGVTNRVDPVQGGVQSGGRWQGKGNLAFTPAVRLPVTVHVNYGRGINSSDARAVVISPTLPRVAATDFYQAGLSSNHGRFSVSASAFLIDHSNEQVYIPDDGSYEFKGRSRAYGYEAKSSFALTRRLSLNIALTKVANAFYRDEMPRLYVDSAPHFVTNAALTVANWKGWSGSLRMRAINHYRLDSTDPSIVASGHTVFDLGLSRRIRRGVEFNFSIDNAANRSYYETQNYFESCVSPLAPVVSRIHGTPGYPLTLMAGLTLRLRGK
ncbi:MAG: TonB-dependent receptor [Bryobacterales bacterium]|nr:TonB-dependent receptor [Bryobacterales bacterium]